MEQKTHVTRLSGFFKAYVLALASICTDGDV